MLNTQNSLLRTTNYEFNEFNEFHKKNQRQSAQCRWFGTSEYSVSCQLCAILRTQNSLLRTTNYEFNEFHKKISDNPPNPCHPCSKLNTQNSILLPPLDSSLSFYGYRQKPVRNDNTLWCLSRRTTAFTPNHHFLTDGSKTTRHPSCKITDCYHKTYRRII